MNKIVQAKMNNKEFKTRLHNHILDSIDTIKESGPLSPELIDLKERVKR